MIVAELSANHNGSLLKALKLIDAAARAGADAVKLQTFTPECMTLDHDGPDFVIRSAPWAGKKLYELYQEARTPWTWHHQLFAHARSHGLICFSSPFSIAAVNFLEQFNPPCYKIASFEVTDLELISAAAATGKGVIISTGCATHSDLVLAVNAALFNSKHLTLLHCVSAYPADAKSFNLPRMKKLQQDFGCDVGISDHTLSVTLPAVAAALGATVIEKHLTLARSDSGPDAAFSLEPHEFKAMVQNIHEARAAMLPASQPSFAALKRSLYVTEDIALGAEFSEHNIRAIRPGNGLHPVKLRDVLGRKALVVIKRGTPLSMELVA